MHLAIKAQNASLLANIFGAIGNYLYCAACIVSALGVWEKRLAGLHKVMTRGPEDQRTRGPEDQRTRGPEDQGQLPRL